MCIIHMGGNEKGVIIARDLRGIALYNKIEELLNEI